MQMKVAETFDDYVASGDETTRHILRENGDIVQAIRQYYTFLSSEIWEGPAKVRPLPAMLAMNSFMLLLSAIRISMTGHASAVFPLSKYRIRPALSFTSRLLRFFTIAHCKRYVYLALGNVSRFAGLYQLGSNQPQVLREETTLRRLN